MGLENLSNPFNDISQNSIERVDKANSPVGDLSENSNSFGRYSENPITDAVFANQSIQLKSGQSFLENKEHTFGSQGRYTELITIDRIEKQQIDSPIAAVVSNGTTTLSKKEGNSNLDLYGGYSGNTIDPDVRKKELNVEIGKNNRLGAGDFVFDTLYNVNQTAKVDRVLIDTGRTDENGKKITINTMAPLIGQAWSNMDIRSAPNDIRGDEPYIVNDIGITKSGQIEVGNNRDTIPFNKSLEDYSRLAKFYTSEKGLAFIAKENVTGALFSSLFTVSPTKIWNGYPGSINLADPLPVIRKVIKDGVTEAVLGAANTSNARLLATNIHIPPLPTPGFGNTGFFNFVNSAFQSGGGNGSIRRPGTFVSEYSTIIKSGVEEFSKIYQLGNIQNISQYLTISDGEFNPLKRVPLTFRRNVDSIIDGSPDLEAAADVKLQSQPFLKYNEVFTGVGPARLKNYGSSGVDDKIAKSLPLDEGLGVGENFAVVPAPPLETSPDLTAHPKNKDFYVRIKDLRNNKYIYFRGFVTGITENVNPSFTSTNYIGRSEPVYLYERAERDISFNLRLYPNNEEEFDAMYEKIRYLTSLAYPEYMPDAGLTRMKAPFTELYMAHIGSRRKGQFGFIKSLSYTVDDAGDWDADLNLPKLFNVAISYQMLHKEAPKSTNEFYRLTT